MNSGKRHAFSAAGSSMSSTNRLSANSRRQSKRKLVRLQRQRCISDEQHSAEARPADDGEYWIGVAPLLDMQGTARVLACKAANISSAMLAHRRKSSALTALGGTLPSFGAMHKKSSGASSSMTSPKWQQSDLFHQTMPTPGIPAVSAAAAAQNRRQTARESVAVLAENWGVFTMDPTAASAKEDITDDLLCCMGLFEFSLKLACLASMISVCLHTPHTTSQWPSLHYWLLTTDIICTGIFSLDALLKINSRASLRDRWCQFDLVLLLFHYLSICVHCAELLTWAWPLFGIRYQGWWGTVRSPRPFIMIKFIRSVIRFKLPRNRIQLIMKRSSQQIQNVTIFFLFFMTLYAIMGVQLFGRMEYHCVLPGTDPNNIWPFPTQCARRMAKATNARQQCNA